MSLGIESVRIHIAACYQVRLSCADHVLCGAI